MGSVGRTGRLVAAALRADCRRPASWLAGATVAAAVGGVVSLPDGSMWLPAILAAGGIAAVAAIGDPPRGVAGPVWAWAGARAVWPAAGVLGAVGGAAILAAAGVAAIPEASGRSLAALLSAWAASAAAAVAVTVAFRCGATAAEASSLALAGVAAGAAAAAAAPAGPLAVRSASGIGAAVVVAGLVIPGLATMQRRSVGGPNAPTFAAMLDGIAMASTLVAMAGWLFLVPSQSGRYALLVAAWFVVLAVPRAVLGSGSRDDACRRRLASESDSLAWRTAGFYAAVLGWPLVVAAALSGDRTTAADRLLVVAGLAGAAVVTAAVTRAVLAVGGTRDSAQALILGIACLTAAGAAAGAGKWANPGGNDVEQTGASCKTPGSPQQDAVPPPV
jgi:hypothetical protein